MLYKYNDHCKHRYNSSIKVFPFVWLQLRARQGVKCEVLFRAWHSLIHIWVSSTDCLLWLVLRNGGEIKSCQVCLAMTNCQHQTNCGKSQSGGGATVTNQTWQMGDAVITGFLLVNWKYSSYGNHQQISSQQFVIKICNYLLNLW